MKRLGGIIMAIGLTCALVVGSVWAQQQPPKGKRPPTSPNDPKNNKDPEKDKTDKQAEEARLLKRLDKVKGDAQLVAIHTEFIRKAETLAKDYEKKKQDDKARLCYEEILRLVPTYSPAQDAMQQIKDKEAKAEEKIFDVLANKDWQDTGITLLEGKPISIQAAGTWTFVISEQLTADGIPIPEQLRDFNLGALIGMVATGDPKDIRPFFIGTSTQFTAEKGGRLYLRMYDNDPKDNVGKLSVKVVGTFRTP